MCRSSSNEAVNRISVIHRVHVILVIVEWFWNEAFLPFCELEKTLWPMTRDSTALSRGKKAIYCLQSKICLHFLVTLFLKHLSRSFSAPRSCQGRYRFTKTYYLSLSSNLRIVVRVCNTNCRAKRIGFLRQVVSSKRPQARVSNCRATYICYAMSIPVYRQLIS